jgi:hypothetical protein
MNPVSDQLFTFEGISTPIPSHERCSAEDLGLKESWFRDAIFASPELVIGPCRAAGLTDDDWYPWRKEFETEVGPIDVLLLSSQGRLALVETKLASNPELRRKVLAQALDYLAHLPIQFQDSMPELPVDANGMPVADPEDIRESIEEGDVLLIIASDQCDPRVAKLSRSLLADNLVKHWDLALVDLALYRPSGNPGRNFLIVSHLRSLVESEPRQVVKVIVQGESPRATVEVQRITRDETAPGRRKWDEQRFFERLETGTVSPAVRRLALDLRDLASRFRDSVTLEWGTGREGSMVLKRHGQGLIELSGRGFLRFRPRRFERALGTTHADDYRQGLLQLAPRAMAMTYPFVAPEEAAKLAAALFDLIRNVISAAETTQGAADVEP